MEENHETKHKNFRTTLFCYKNIFTDSRKVVCYTKKEAKKMIIAICNNINAFNNNQILEKSVARQFPGSEWVIHLDDLSSNDFKVVTGDIALEMIKDGLDPKKILVVNELNSKHGKKILNKGGIPFIQTGFESPLIAWFFYDNMAKASSPYKNRMLYKGIYDTIDFQNGKSYFMRFPSYNREDIREPFEWEKRKDVVMVVSNKHINAKTYWKPSMSIKYYIKCKLAEIMKEFSSTYVAAKKNQLHNLRHEIIHYFGSGDDMVFDLYGRGWGDANIKYLDKNIKKTINELNPQMCEDKIDITSRYKYAICLENMSYHGYVTEKIIDCFVAGVIPIYLGAPDIADFVPTNAIIDLREYETLDELYFHINNMTEEEALQKIEAGQEFLKKSNSQENLFCNEDFARFIFELAKEEKKIYDS